MGNTSSSKREKQVSFKIFEGQLAPFLKCWAWEVIKFSSHSIRIFLKIDYSKKKELKVVHRWGCSHRDSLRGDGAIEVV